MKPKESNVARLPTCKDFIIPAIRKLRTKPWNLRRGSSAAVLLPRLFKVSRDVYSEKEFRKAFDALVKDGTITVIACERRDGKFSDIRLKKLPPRVFLNQRWWHFDQNGNLIKNEDETRRPGNATLSIGNPKVYITSDGFPLKYRTPEARHSMAFQIIASMQAERKHKRK